jgi:hypothetical protein
MLAQLTLLGRDVQRRIFYANLQLQPHIPIGIQMGGKSEFLLGGHWVSGIVVAGVWTSPVCPGL